MYFEICLENLGAYNEGELRFTWLHLPFTEEELSEALKKIGIGEKDCFGCEYEEYFVPDWDCDLPFATYSEYPDLGEWNSMAEWAEGAEWDAIECVGYLMENDISMKFEEAVDIYEQGDVFYVDNISDERDVGEWFAEEYGILWGVPDELSDYFDFERYGRDFVQDGTANLYGCGMVVDYR